MTGNLENRYDIVSNGDYLEIVDHFCREPGCYGTNADHGYTLEEAISHVASWHEMQAKTYRDGTHYKLQILKGI